MEKFVKWMSGKTAGYILELISVWLMAFAALQMSAVFGLEIENSVLILILLLVFGMVHMAGKIMGQPYAGIAAVFVLSFLLFVIPVFRGYRFVLICALAGYFLIFLIHWADWLRRIYALAGIVALGTAFFMGMPLSKILVGIVILLFLKEVVSFWGGEIGVRMLPFLLLFQILILLIPTRDTPLDWSFVYRMGDSINQFCQTVMMETEYLMESMGFRGQGSGYGNIGGLAGSLIQTDREELYLGSRPTRGNLYLAGREYETLEGQRWNDTARDQIPQYAWYARYLNALYHSGITEEEVECFSRFCSNEITFGYLRTQDVIHPSNVLRMEDTLAADLTGEIGDYTFESSKGKDYSYRIDFMEFDFSNPYLIELLRECPEIEKKEWATYEELDRLSRDIYEKSISTVISKEEYQLYQIMLKHVEEESLDISGISERTAELALQITENCDSDFDKAKAIETYLRQYPYSPDVDLRSYEDFVDAFLFEAKSGYCTHYASAMVMLLRANGIPARLVQGYCCAFQNQPVGVKQVTVLGSYAHAWPEAYIRGFGWVQFEPTAIMETAEQYGWNMRVKEKTESPGTGTGLPGEEGEIPFMESVPETEPEEEEIAEEELQEEQERRQLILWLIILPVAAVIALLGLNQLMKKIRYMRKNSFQKLDANLEDIKWLIRELYPDQPWENRHLLDYAAALADPGQKELMRGIVIRYYELRYKGGKLSAVEEIKVISLWESLYGEYLAVTGAERFKRRVKVFFALQTG